MLDVLWVPLFGTVQRRIMTGGFFQSKIELINEAKGGSLVG